MRDPLAIAGVLVKVTTGCKRCIALRYIMKTALLGCEKIQVAAVAYRQVVISVVSSKI